MDKADKDLLANELFDSVVQPINWRPVHLARIEALIEQWVDKYVERKLRELQTTDKC